MFGDYIFSPGRMPNAAMAKTGYRGRPVNELSSTNRNQYRQGFAPKIMASVVVKGSWDSALPGRFYVYYLLPLSLCVSQATPSLEFWAQELRLD